MFKQVMSFFLMTSSALIVAGCAKQTLTTETKQEPQHVALNAVPLSVEYQPVALSGIQLSNLNMNNQGNQITVKPSSTITVSTQYIYDCKKCKSDLNNQILVGLAGRSAQACIYNGGAQGQGSADFTLKAPAKPGKYKVRFLPIQAADCNDALKKGWDAETSPSKNAVQAAQDILKELEYFNAHVKTMKKEFKIRCGVNAGFVYYDDTIPLEHFSDRTIDIAGHMQKHAPPNSILIAKHILEPVKSHQDFAATKNLVDGLEVCEWNKTETKDT